MKLLRRRFLLLAAVTAAPLVVSRIARAQTYPSRPVHLVVGFPPGATTDIVARLVGQWLSERLGAPFIVENRSGAAGNIGTDAVVRSPPDGYTLLLVGPAAMIMLHFTTNSISISSATSRRSQASCASPASWWLIHLSSQDHSRVYCLRQGQSGQSQHGVGVIN